MKKTSSDVILKEELKAFNWTDVDEYPSFSQCDSLTLKEKRKDCFQSILTTHISSFLQNENIVVSRDIRDTIILNFQVSKTGDLNLLETKIDSAIHINIPEIETLLYESLEFLPEIFPATKRGQQVNTEFTLPIIIHAN